MDLIIWWTKWIWKALLQIINNGEWKSCIYTWRINESPDSMNIFYKLDLGKIGEINQIIEKIYSAHTIHNLYLIWWESNWGDIINMNIEELYYSLNSNLISHALIAQFHIKYCIKKKLWTSIITIWSLTWIKWWKIGYSISKAWIIALTKSIAKSVWDKWIRCNCIIPGAVNTNMINDRDEDKKHKIWWITNLWRIAEPVEIAEIAYYLWINKSSYLNWSVIDATAWQR